MEARAILRYARISPRKVSIVMDLIRNKPLDVAECFVCPGPTLKRMMPRAQGRGYRILKRTSHMTVVLKEKE